MLTESDVIAAVCGHLRARGYEIRQCLSETERGDDIIAVRGDETLFVEAKGETSSKSTSARYGKRFDMKQVQSHIAKALYWAAARVGDEGNTVAIALPKNEKHMTALWPIERTLSRLEIRVFWVDADGSVVESQ